jgi:hypothetical protein
MCDRSHLSEQAIDSRARRAARHAGLIARKSRRSMSIDNWGGYMLIDARRNCVNGSRFDLTAEDIISFCKPQASEREIGGAA